MQPVLKFNVRNQNISRVDTFLPVRYSRNYLYAEFDFKTCDWNEKTKTAIFSGTGLEPIPVILGETDTCLVPWEVLECTEFTVTVHAGDLITVDSAKVKLYESGYRPGDVPEPTPNVYQQLINMLTDQVDGLSYTDNILSLMAGEKSIASVTITGGSGSGTDGREVELQNNGTHIQWRYVGEESWTNLIALEDIKGQAGDDGSPGKPGRDGTTPHIGENMHWYIGDTDTGVVAEGKDGATGEKGEPGEKGDPGENGETGANGADGYSPTASVSKSGTVTTITITDKNGTTTEEILDGKKGADGKGITSVTIKADGHLRIDYDDGTNADVGKVVGEDGLDGASGVPIKQEMTASDTDVELQPNIFYLFPEIETLEISFADPTDTTAVAEYHFLFQSGATATTLTLPDTVKLPSSFSVDASKIYEVSILEGCLCAQSWAVS